MILIEVSRRLSRALSGCITCDGSRCAAICEGRRPSHLRLVTYLGEWESVMVGGVGC